MLPIAGSVSEQYLDLPVLDGVKRDKCNSSTNRGPAIQVINQHFQLIKLTVYSYPESLEDPGEYFEGTSSY
jgi:hypothetical protein